MNRIAFGQLPFAAKIAVGIAFYGGFWFFEDRVIDCYGIWKYLPYYKKGDFCAWDAAAIVVIALSIWWASHRGGA